jgi:molecular chaperone DnaK (HSP70)
MSLLGTVPHISGWLSATSCIFGAGAKHLSMTITRGKFEQLVDSLLNRTRQPCKDCLKDAGISQSEVTEVLLVGGMTRMPKVGRTPRT